MLFRSKDFLSDGGRVLIEVPDITRIMPEDFSPFHIQHLNYFSPKTIANLLANSGLAVESINTYLNYNIDRDPYFPTLLAIGRKDRKNVLSGDDLIGFVSGKRKEIKEKIEKRFGSKFSLAVAACGDTLYPFLKLFPEAKLVGLFDNDNKIMGKEIFGVKILSVPEVKNCHADLVVVCTLNRHNASQISKQLASYMDRGKIMTFFD